jgi:hypothetical protein
VVVVVARLVVGGRKLFLSGLLFLEALLSAALVGESVRPWYPEAPGVHCLAWSVVEQSVDLSGSPSVGRSVVQRVSQSALGSVNQSSCWSVNRSISQTVNWSVNQSAGEKV